MWLLSHWTCRFCCDGGCCFGLSLALHVRGFGGRGTACLVVMRGWRGTVAAGYPRWNRCGYALGLPSRSYALSARCSFCVFLVDAIWGVGWVGQATSAWVMGACGVWKLACLGKWACGGRW